MRRRGMKKGEFLKNTFDYTTHFWNKVLSGERNMSYPMAKIAQEVFKPYGYESAEIWQNDSRTAERNAAWKALCKDKGITIRKAA